MARNPLTCLFILLLSTLVVLHTKAAIDWLQISANNERTQTNIQETVLTSSNISPQTFGKIFQRNTIGESYAQPLYVTDVYIPQLGVTRNIVIIVTNMNNVYAFDAHDPNMNDPLWTRNLGPTVPISDNQIGTYCIETYGGYTDIQYGVGILSTPYVDKQRGTIYLVAFSKQMDAGNPDGFYYMYNAYGLDISTGAIKLGPARIDTEPGFNYKRQLQRPGLTAVNNFLFIGFGSVCDTPGYKGYVFVYSLDTLEKRYVYKPCNDRCGIWQSGQGFVIVDDNIFVKTSNGPYDTTQNNYATSLLKLKVDSSSGQLSLQDYFSPTTPVVSPRESGAGAIDMGPGCATHIPNTNLLVVGGKEPHLYVLNQNNMGKFNATGDSYNTVYKCTDCVEGRMYATPVIWKQDNLGYFAYVWSEYGSFKQYRFTVTSSTRGQFIQPLFRDNNVIASRFGGFVTVSSNGGTAGSGIVWASHSDRNPNIVKGGILRAYDAEDIGNELWNSQMQADRDNVGFYPKFVSPMVNEGSVYLPGFSVGGSDNSQTTRLNVYAHLAPRIIRMNDITVNTEAMYAALKLNVIATGSNAGFAIKWYKDGVELIENLHYSRVNPNTAAVIILSTSTTNIAKGGSYNMKVVISNAQGQAEKDFTIVTTLAPVGEKSLPVAMNSTKPQPSPVVSTVIPKQSPKPIPQQSQKPISASYSYNFSAVILLLLFVTTILL